MNSFLDLFRRTHDGSRHQTVVAPDPPAPRIAKETKRGMTREDVKSLSVEATASLVWEIAKLHPQPHEVVAIFIDLAEAEDEERERVLDRLIRDLIRDVDAMGIDRQP